MGQGLNPSGRAFRTSPCPIRKRLTKYSMMRRIAREYRNMECSPSFDKLRTMSKVESLGELNRSLLCYNRLQVKLKLDTPKSSRLWSVCL